MAFSFNIEMYSLPNSISQLSLYFPYGKKCYTYFGNSL